MDNYVGKRLDGRYEVQEIVGVGGMSVVYKAYDNVDDRIVAIKILKEEFLNNEEFKRRFKNESKAIALLSHPNIVKVYDVNFGEKLQYIVMEYIDGITLKEYITKQGAITWNDALFFMSQILHAVQHAHDKGIVHRDIKPQNILLLQNGNIKVTDFGIARFSRSDTRTLTEQAIGSVHYIAPEQAKGEYTDEKADIYSLGVVLYEMLAGTVPFEADSAVSVALMQLQADAKKLTDINPDIPVGLEQICIHAMQKDPIDRYHTASEMLLDIEEVIKDPNKTFNYVSKIDRNPTKIVDIKKNPVPSVQTEVDDYDEEDDEYLRREHKKKVVTAVCIGVIVLAAAIVLLVMGIVNGEIFGVKLGTGVNAETVTLENFEGTSYDDIAGKYDYKFSVTYEQTDSYDPGTVIKQSPDAGTKIIKGSQVELVVASTTENIPVPNVYGYTVEKAEQALKNVGLNSFKTMTVSSENVAEGEVVYTNPKATNLVTADTEITLYISSGPSTTVIKTLKVPDVTGLTKDGARAFLEAYGFSNVSFVTQDSSIKQGVVITSSPSPGASVRADSSIKVMISSGVTTTTTERQIKESVTVKLPKCIDEDGDTVSDTLVVTLDGDVYSSQKVSLDGNEKTLSIQCEGTDKKKIVISLDSTGAAETITTSGQKNESFTVDFTSFSSDDSTQPSEQTETTKNKKNKSNN